MFSGILIAITVACLITAVTIFCSITMCLHLRKRRRPTKQVDEESTLESFPGTVRKLTIDRGNVVTAPPSPGMLSLTKYSRLPISIYAPTSKRSSSTKTAVPEIPAFTFNKDNDISFPSSPLSATSSVSPTSTRAPRRNHSTSQHRSSLVPMPEQAWLESISALSQPAEAITDAERVFNEKRAARRNKIPAEADVQKPKPAVTSDQVSVNAQHRKESLGSISQGSNSSQRKASLGAISQAVSEDLPYSPRKSSTSPPPVHKGSPTLDKNLSATPIPAISHPRSSVYTNASSGSRKAQLDRAKKPRPPPIAITSSQQPPRVPETFLKSPTDSVATVKPNISEATSGIQMLRADNTVSGDARQSIMSFASSQYSATFSIRPVDHVQVSQPVRAQQVLARAATSPNLPQTAQQTPPSTATPTTALFPAGYSMGKVSQYDASIASRIGAEEPATGTVNNKTGSKKQRPPLPPLDRTVSAPTSYDVPLTSASISFPPNLPDFSFSPKSPTDSSAAEKRWHQQEQSHSPEKPRKSSAPQPAVPKQAISPKLTSKRSESALGQKIDTAALHRAATIAIAELPAREAVASPTSLKEVGLKGTATVSISELAKKAAMERARANVAARRAERQRASEER